LQRWNPKRGKTETFAFCKKRAGQWRCDLADVVVVGFPFADIDEVSSYRFERNYGDDHFIGDIVVCLAWEVFIGPGDCWSRGHILCCGKRIYRSVK
jgi:hypothetical protein